jgi:hypothetical protein
MEDFQLQDKKGKMEGRIRKKKNWGEREGGGRVNVTVLSA